MGYDLLFLFFYFLLWTQNSNITISSICINIKAKVGVQHDATFHTSSEVFSY
jgi:hypothetical protein